MNNSLIHQLYALIAQPAIQSWLANRGMVMGDFNGNRNIADILAEQGYNDDLRRAIGAAAQGDRPKEEALMRGIAAVTGLPWSDEYGRRMSGGLAEIAPYAMALAPDVWDTLHGGQGSESQLAAAIMQENRYNPDFTPQQAVEAAREVVAELGEQGAMGFSAKDLGDIYREGVRRGLIPTAGSPQAVAEALRVLVRPAAAARDVLQRNGKQVPMSELFRVIDQTGLIGGADATAETIATAGQYGGTTTASGLGSAPGSVGASPYVAAARAHGTAANPAPGNLPLSQLATASDALERRAAGSQLGRMVAATERLAQVYQIQPGSPAAKMLENMRRGAVSPMGLQQWTAILAKSGIPAATAHAVLSDPNTINYLTPELRLAVRKAQYGFTVGPLAAAIQKQYPGTGARAKLMRETQLNRLARQYGYKTWDQVQQLHGQAAQEAPKFYQAAKQRAQKQMAVSGIGRQGAVSRVVSQLQQIKPGERAAGRKLVGSLFNVTTLPPAAGPRPVPALG